jgi:hypothetical protein
MRFGSPLDPDEVADRIRLFLSIAGAVFIASCGFASIFLFVGYLPTLVFTWADHHPQAVGALHSLSRRFPIWLFIVQFSVALPWLGALAAMLISRRKLRYNHVKAVHPL